MKKVAGLYLVVIAVLLVGCSKTNEFIIEPSKFEIEQANSIKTKARLESLLEENKEVQEHYEKLEQTEVELYNSKKSNTILKNTRVHICSLKDALPLLEAEAIPGITQFVEQVYQVSTQAVEVRSKRFGECIVTVNTMPEIQNKEGNTSTTDSLGITFILNKIKDEYYQELIKQIMTKDFIVSDFKVGDKAEFIEISNLFGVSDLDLDYRNRVKATYNLPAQVSYRLYTHKQELNKIRAIFIKQQGKALSPEDVEPLYNSLSLLGGSQEELTQLEKVIELINSDKIGKKRGTIGELKYYYRGTRNDSSVLKNYIELIIE